MKKTIFIALTAFTILALAACQKKSDPQPLAGGWTTPEDPAITPELRAIFDQGIGMLDGVVYEPLELLGTQVVAGINYKFRALATPVVENPESKELIIVIYRDLQGNCSLLRSEASK